MSQLTRWTVSVLVVGLWTCVAESQTTPQPQPKNPAPSNVPNLPQPPAQPENNQPMGIPKGEPLGTPKKGFNPPVRPTGIAAKVNGQELSLAAVERALMTVPPDKKAEARMDAINFLVDNILVDQALNHWKITAEKKDIDAQYKEFVEDLKSRKQDINVLLANLMMTEAELKEQFDAQLKWEKFVNQQAPEATLKKFFEQNPEMFDGTMVRALHIQLNMTKDPKANEANIKALRELKVRIEASATQELEKSLAVMNPKPDNLAREQLRIKYLRQAFMDAARDKSDCPTKKNGGDLNWFPRVGGSASPVEPISKASFAMKPHEISDVIASDYGYHILMVIDRRPGQPTKFETVKEAVKEVYGIKLRDKIIDTMRKQAKVEIFPAKN